MAHKLPDPDGIYCCNVTSCDSCGVPFLGSEFTRRPDYDGTSGWSGARFEAPCGHARYLGNFGRLERTDGVLALLSERAITDRSLGRPVGWPLQKAMIFSEGGTTMWVYHAEYWHRYSRRVGSYFVGASYLCGIEHGQVWAVRVPRSITSVAKALGYITPAAVKHARDRGLEVLRQGEVWLVPTVRAEDWDLLPPTHEVLLTDDWGGRALVHSQHGTLPLPAGVKFRVHLNKSVHGTGQEVD